MDVVLLPMIGAAVIASFGMWLYKREPKDDKSFVRKKKSTIVQKMFGAALFVIGICIAIAAVSM